MEWIDRKRIPEVRVRITGLGVRQRLIGGREIRWLEIGGPRVGKRGGWTVEMLADSGEMRQSRIPIAASIMAVLRGKNECNPS